MRNEASSGMLSLCTAPGMRLTSLSEMAKQSANSEMRASTSLCWAGVTSSPIVTSSCIFATRAGKNGSV